MRNLRFQTIAEALAELDRLERAGSLETTGLWSYPQILDHLAGGFEFSISAYPSLVPSFIRKTLGKLVYSRMVKNGFMSAGSPNPSAPKVREEGDPKVAMKRLRKAISRFEAHRGEMALHPMFDKLSKDQFAHLHAMHMANHLGFLVLDDVDSKSSVNRNASSSKAIAGKKSSRKSSKKSSKKSASKSPSSSARKPAKPVSKKSSRKR